jgi:hypothetical protein
MFLDISLWEKLWNKGVDIAASVIASTITAGIVALIATLTWKRKRRLDLEFEMDKIRQVDKHNDENTEKGEDKRISRLKGELGPLAEGVEIAGRSGDPKQCTAAWEAYTNWLATNKLEFIPHNRSLLNQWADISRETTDSSKALAWANQMASKVKQTQLTGDEATRASAGATDTPPTPPRKPDL